MAGWSAGLAVAINVTLGIFAALCTYHLSENSSEETRVSIDLEAVEFTITMHRSETYASFGNFFNKTLVLHSNGSAEFSYHETATQTLDKSYSIIFPPGIVQHAYDTLVNEGVFSLNERQVDCPHSEKGRIVVTTLELDAAQPAHIVFEGNSMAGIMPDSYVVLWNLAGATIRGVAESFDISFNVSLSDPDPVTNLVHVTLSLTNNEEQTVYAISWPPLWMPVVAKESGWTALGDPWWNVTWATVITSYSIEPHSTLTLGTGFWWNIDDMGNGTYVIMSSVSLGSTERAYSTGEPPSWMQCGRSIVSLGDGDSFEDSPPCAFISMPARNGETGTALLFDSSYSSDREDRTSELEYRWDFDGDGTWDTDWTNESVVSYEFERPGNYSVCLQVRDSSGLVNGTFVSVLIAGETGFGLIILIAGVAAIAAAATLTVFSIRRGAKPPKPK